MADRNPPVAIAAIVVTPDRKDRKHPIPFPKPLNAPSTVWDAYALVINDVWLRVLAIFTSHRGDYCLRYFCHESLERTTDKSFLMKMHDKYSTRHGYEVTPEILAPRLHRVFLDRLTMVSSPWLLWDPTLEDPVDTQCCAPGPSDPASPLPIHREPCYENWDSQSVQICIRADLIEEYMRARRRRLSAGDHPQRESLVTDELFLIFRLVTAMIDAFAHLFQIFLHNRDDTARACTPTELAPARVRGAIASVEQSQQSGDAGKWMQANLFGGVVQWLTLDGEGEDSKKPKVPHMILDKPTAPECLMEVDPESIKKLLWSRNDEDLGWTDVRKYMVTIIDAEENDAIFGDVVWDIANMRGLVEHGQHAKIAPRPGT